MEAIFGKTLTTKDGEKPTKDVLSGKAGVMIYFSAHWCPPCRGFTPKLSKFYSKHAEAKNFEIVFVSSDKTEEEFKEYHGEMPFPALPYSDRDKKGELSKKYGVQGIPTLVVLDAEGQVTTKNGRQKVTQNLEDCKGFPWAPLTFEQALGPQLRKKDGTMVDTAGAIGGKTVGIYFSAHWCPPCRGFTPKLAEFYAAYKKLDPNFEIIFSSGDKSEEEGNSYFSEDHGDYLMIPFSHEEGRSALDEIYEVDGIPAFVIIDDKGNVINKEGRAKIAAGPEAVKKDGWEPPVVGDLAKGPGACGTDINEAKTCVVMLHGLDDDAQADALKEITVVAAELKEKAGATECKTPEFIFLESKESGGMADQIAALTKKNGGPRLQMPCSDGEPVTLLFDIPSGGAFYVSGETDVTADKLRAFLKNPGDRKQLER